MIEDYSISAGSEELVGEEQFTDTSMFDADEIVRKVEEFARQRKLKDESLNARQRMEMLMEERRLRAEIEEYDNGVGDALPELDN